MQRLTCNILHVLSVSVSNLVFLSMFLTGLLVHTRLPAFDRWVAHRANAAAFAGAADLQSCSDR